MTVAGIGACLANPATSFALQATQILGSGSWTGGRIGGRTGGIKGGFLAIELERWESR